MPVVRIVPSRQPRKEQEERDNRERTLPRPEREPAIRDGQLERHADDGALGMADAVVRALVDVVPLERLGHNVVEDAVEVGAHVGVAVLVDGETRRGVLQEEEEHADLVGVGGRAERGYRERERGVRGSGGSGQVAGHRGRRTLTFLSESPRPLTISSVTRWQLLARGRAGRTHTKSGQRHVSRSERRVPRTPFRARRGG